MNTKSQSPCPKEIRDWLDTLFVGDALNADEGRQLFAHLEGCTACQSEYDQIMLASRMLESDDPLQPSEIELAGTKAALFDQLEKEEAFAQKQSPSKRNTLWRGLLAATTLAAGAAAIAIVMLRMPAPSTGMDTNTGQPQFAIRGGSANPDTDSAGIGLRAFCLDGKSGEPKEIKPTTAKSELQTCDLNQVLRFAYSNRGKSRYLYLLGVDEKFQPYWYAPAPPETRSIAIAKDVNDGALERAVKLEVNHHAGLLRIFALFSEEPLEAATIEKALAEAKDAKGSLKGLDRLPIANIAQRSLLLGLQ
jgi:hypothetical protein